MTRAESVEKAAQAIARALRALESETGETVDAVDLIITDCTSIEDRQPRYGTTVAISFLKTFTRVWL